MSCIFLLKGINQILGKGFTAMTSYFVAFSWGICIILSLVGWGGVLNRILFPKDRVGWGQRSAWGIAFSVVVGGVLNVTWTISRTVVLIYLGLGLVYWLFDFYKNRDLVLNSLSQEIRECRKDKVVFIGTLIICLLILVQYAGWVSTPLGFNTHDDYHGYFVFPNKMLQMGSMGPDPFSDRRLVSSLGGQTFLDTFILSTLSYKNLNLLDSGCGLIITIGLLLGYFKEKKLSKRRALLTLLLFFVLLISISKVNITRVVFALALFLSLFITLDWKPLNEHPSLSNSFIIALLITAICAVKSNLIPACIILFILSYYFYIFNSKIKPKAISEFCVTTLLVGVFLLPWMISMYQSSGTFLYPLLGKGYHGSVYGSVLLPSSELTILKAFKIFIVAVTSRKFLALYLLSFIILGRLRQKLIVRNSPLSLLISCWLGTILLALATGGGVFRYSESFVVATLIIFITLSLADTGLEAKSKFQPSTSVIAAIFIAGLFLGSTHPRDVYGESISNIKLGLNNVDLVSTQDLTKYTRMLQSIPEKEMILTRLKKPFLLDFSRNRIFIADYPGGASLPPGMPFFKGSEPLADYLTSKSIRYVAYSYANEAGFDKKRYEARLRPETYTWSRTQAQHTFNFQDNLKELGETRKRIYDDGENFVLDLLSLKK
jgi:predicted small integral membrane protein